MIDSDGPDGKPMSMFESGAMLLYLASKTGNSCRRTSATAGPRCNG